MIQALKRGLGGLANFTGRSPQGEFWPYAGAVIMATFAGIMLSVAPEVAKTFVRMQRFAAEHPDQATVTQTATSYSVSIDGYHPELMPDMGGMAASMGAVLAVTVILLAAAVVRRLRDSGRTGFWGLLPLPFLAIGLTGFPRLFAAFDTPEGPPLPLFFALFANNFAYLASLALLVFLLTRPTKAKAGRYDRTPAA